MPRFLAGRLAVAVPTLFLVATLTFFLVHLIPGDPGAYVLGAGATKAQIAQEDRLLGFDRPLTAQYLSWLGGLLHGNLGTSFQTGQPVSTIVAQALPVTVSLAVLATAFTVVVGVLCGTFAAVRGGTADRVVTAAAGFTMAVPNFWLATLLIWALGIKLRIVPVGDYVALTQNPVQWFNHLILPAVATGVIPLGQVAFQSRAATLDVLSRDFVRTLRACGVPRRRILLRHVLRNASVPVVTVVSMSFVFTLGGVVVVEELFNLSGMGYQMLGNVSGKDLGVVQAFVLVFTTMVILVNLLTDLLTARLDPRIRA
jgi:peptide/nickel transport system permease protein